MLHPGTPVAAMSFMLNHGVLKDIYTERDSQSHKTARGKKLSLRTMKAPGLGPKGIHRFVLPFIVFLKLKDIDGNVLPTYQEELVDIRWGRTRTRPIGSWPAN